jgi:hypothetical protein
MTTRLPIRAAFLAMLFVLTHPNSAEAGDRRRIRPTEAVDAGIRKELSACLKQAVTDASREGGLIVPGLKSCYQTAFSRWEAATAPVTETLLAAQGSACAKAVEALLQEWEQYATRLTELAAVQDMPINTDDDLRLVLHKHRYETMLAMSANVECPKLKT